MEDSQPGTDEKGDLEKRIQHLEKLVQFYEEYVVTVPLSKSIKVERKQSQQKQQFLDIFVKGKVDSYSSLET